MKKYFSFLPIFAIVAFLIYSCKEKEKELVASPDILVSVRKSELVLDVKAKNTSEKEKAEKEIQALLMSDSVNFIAGHVYEMRLDKSRPVELYASLKDFHKDKILLRGNYQFATDTMLVSFSIEEGTKTFTIGGHSAKIFYNHFVRTEGTGEHHIIEGAKVFCLNENFTASMQEKFPEVEVISAHIKTDMMTIRPLETFK